MVIKDVGFKIEAFFWPINTNLIMQTVAYSNFKFVFDKADVALLTNYLLYFSLCFLIIFLHFGF